MFTTLLKSFAKINLGLRILKKRDDGYHDLETIFYPVKLHDEIFIEVHSSHTGFNSLVLKSNIRHLPLNKDNLCYKAIERFFKTFGIKDCFKINIDLKKNIPIGGGLGGGSSNAATLIKFFVKYFKINVSENRKSLLDLASSIGSDVPFFLILKPCYAEGRGENLTVLENFKLDYDILIVNPNLHISTRWAFEKLNFTPDNEKEPLLKDVNSFSLNHAEIFSNDFEDLVFRKYNELKIIKDELIEKGAVYSSMSGSGATMYGLFDKNNKDVLRNCFEYYKKKKYFAYISD